MAIGQWTPPQPMSFEQANPMLQGLQQGIMFPQQFKQAMLDNMIKQVQANYAQPMAQQGLLKAQLENQWLPKLNQSTIGLQGAQAGLYGSEANKNNFLVNHPGLLTSSPEAQTIALAGMSGADPRLAALAQAQIAKENAMASYYGMGGSNMGVGMKDILGFQRQLGQEYNIDPDKARQFANAMLAGQTSLPDGTPVPSASELDKQLMNQILKSGTTAQGLNQQRAGSILDTLLDKGNDLMPNVSEFAGLAGKANQTASQVAASLGNNDKRYLDYLNFTRQIVPQVANQMLLTEGGRATNTQKQMMMDIANPVTWDSNPKLALQQYQFLRDTFKSTVSPTVAASPIELKQQLARGGNKPATSNKDDEIVTVTDSQTGQKTRMTRKEAKKLMEQK